MAFPSRNCWFRSSLCRPSRRLCRLGIREIISTSEAETLEWAVTFSRQLAAGDTVGLSGILGAGKTVICRGIAAGLGFSGNVHSPSYALVHEYACGIPLFHMDLFRLSQNSDWEEIGLDHYFGLHGICLIEWPERLPEGNRLSNRIEIQREGEARRRIRVIKS